ncbi:mosc domain-containing protein [Botrytis cinerea]
MTTNTSHAGGMATSESFLDSLWEMMEKTTDYINTIHIPILGEWSFRSIFQIVLIWYLVIRLSTRSTQLEEYRKRLGKAEAQIQRDEESRQEVAEMASDLKGMLKEKSGLLENIQELASIVEKVDGISMATATAQQTNPSKSISAPSGPEMTISQLYIYPIKSLRGCSLPSATLTKEGFSYDRKFMLLRVRDPNSKWGPLHSARNLSRPPLLLLLLLTNSPPPHPTLTIDLSPTTLSHLPKISITMHKSPITAYDMGAPYNNWFTQYFGYPVLLAYAGANRRLVLGNIPGKPATYTPPLPTPTLLHKIPLLNSLLPTPTPSSSSSSSSSSIIFNDCAPYLIITQSSCDDVTSRLPAPGPKMDITKFRANIIISGSPHPYDEDYWGGLTFSSSSSSSPSPKKEILLTANCGRCVSLNVDHEKGIAAPKDQEVLKLLMKDRRVDPGMKYSPIFGRYGFLGNGNADEGQILRVGDAVQVSRRNKERTRFYWPGIST